MALDAGFQITVHGVDEPFERPVIETVLDAVRADRLFRVELLREERVEAEEVDQLRGRVDFRLEHRLRLAKHRRRVERLAPGRREQFGGTEKHGGAVFPAPARPFARGARRRGNRLAHVFGTRGVPVRQHVFVVVRHDGLMRATRANLASANHDRDVDALAGHRFQPFLQRRSFGRAGKITEVRLVHGRRNTRDSSDAGRTGGDIG